MEQREWFCEGAELGTIPPAHALVLPAPLSTLPWAPWTPSVGSHRATSALGWRSVLPMPPQWLRLLRAVSCAGRSVSRRG